MKAQLRALGLNKRQINMARLKVKQISDFTSAVNSLIGSGQVAVDDSIDSLESQLSEGLDSLGVIDSAVSNALATEISTTDTEVGSLEVIQSAVSNALATEISTTDTEVGSIEVIQSAISNALATEISGVDTEVASLEVIDSAVSNALATQISTHNTEVASLEAIDSAVSNAVAGILAGADANTDNFSEVISYINSVDNASDLDLIAEMASVDTRFDSADTRFDGLDTNEASMEAIDSAISNALATEISTTDTEIGSLEVIDSAVSNALTNLQNNVGDIDQPSLEAIDSAISNALAAEISTTDTEVGSLEVIDSAISNALATEISTTDGEISDLQDSVDSLESQLNGFAKEAFVHLAVTGLVSGSGATVGVLDTTGAANGDNVTESSGVYTFDLVVPMEAANAIEGEAGLIDLQINGLGVDHDAVRWNSQTSFSILESQLGYVLEASDRVEFKYIRD